MTKKTNKAKQTKRRGKTQPSAIGSLIRTLGGAGGTALGAMVGQPAIGGGAGRELGAIISKWLGAGDYTVASNTVLRDMQAGNSIPSMHKSDQTIVVRHKEYLGEVDGSTGFAVQSILPLNPGVPTTFPWLSAVASRFQEYSLKGAVFHYVPTSGTAISSTSAALGSVMFQTSYRATDNAPLNKVEMLNEYWATEGRPCDVIVHPIECDPKENPFNIHYVRNGLLGTDENQLLYDIGTTYVATNGMQTAGQTVGDLWITYEVELKKPVLASEVADVARAFGSSNAANLSTDLFRTPSAQTIEGNLPITLSANTITLPKGMAGFFYITVLLTPNGSFTSCNWSTTPALTECILVSARTANSAYYGDVWTTLTTGTGFHCQFAVFKADPNAIATIVLSAPVFGGPLLRTDINIFHRDSPLFA